MNRTGKPGIFACDDHKDRTKCAIEGCATSTKRESGSAEWLCPVHWRRHCPPRSLRRRVYHRFFRDAKKLGWTERRTAQFWRFWDTLVRIANAAEAQDAFEAAEVKRINEMFGWTDE